MTLNLAQVLQSAQSVPGAQYKIHVSVPVELLRRSEKAQRASQLRRWETKVGAFDVNKAGAVQAVPNGTMLDVVIGGHRIEAAQKAGIKTLPVIIHPESARLKERQANIFLDELENLRPGTETTHALALTANRQAARLVEEATTQVSTRACAVFYRILGARPTGADKPIPQKRITLLQRVVAELRKFQKEETVPGAVIHGTSILVEAGETIATKWKKQSWDKAVANARVRRARHGGAGTLGEHVALILAGRHH
jgi:hypothetical protein